MFRELVGVFDARKALLDRCIPVGRTESLPITEACGRVLSENVRSLVSLPAFNRAALDGYAVRSADTHGARPQSPIILDHAKAVRTGAPVPEGYDAVVILEDTVIRAAGVEIARELPPYRNVSRIGEDVSLGETVLQMGHRLRPPDIALFAAIGLSDCMVFQRPRIAVIPTGSWLVPPGGKVLGQGQAREINGLMSSLYTAEWGGVPFIEDIVPDDPRLIRAAIQKNLGADLILLSGGTSVGERDYAPRVVEEMGDLIAHGFRLTPGKPTALGFVDSVPVVCLSGYPVAALSALYLFVRPIVKRLAHLADKPRQISAILAGKIPSRPGYLTVARVALSGGMAEPVMTSGAGILSSVTRSDGFVIVPEEREGMEAGEIVDVNLF